MGCTDRGHFEGQRVRTPIPLLKCLRTISGQKCTRLHDFAYTISAFSKGDTPRSLQKHPGAWTHIPIFVWPASVPTVPVYATTILALTSLIELRHVVDGPICLLVQNKQ